MTGKEGRGEGGGDEERWQGNGVSARQTNSTRVASPTPSSSPQGSRDEAVEGKE